MPITNKVFAQSDDIEVTDLETEYTDNPIGIDETEPRLSWKLESTEKGQKQTAYQIQVASSKDKLLDNQPDIRETGKVESSQSGNIVYEGNALESSERYFWRVKVWDKHQDDPSEWSDPAFWEMGLLEESDWQGDWIGLDGDYGVPIDTSDRNETVRLESDHTLG